MEKRKIKVNIIRLYINGSNRKDQENIVILRLWIPKYILSEKKEVGRSYNDYGIGLYYFIKNYYKKQGQSNIIKFLKKNFQNMILIDNKNHYNYMGSSSRIHKRIQELRITIDEDILERLKILLVKRKPEEYE